MNWEVDSLGFHTTWIKILLKSRSFFKGTSVILFISPIFSFENTDLIYSFDTCDSNLGIHIVVCDIGFYYHYCGPYCIQFFLDPCFCTDKSLIKKLIAFSHKFIKNKTCRSILDFLSAAKKHFVYSV